MTTEITFPSHIKSVRESADRRERIRYHRYEVDDAVAWSGDGRETRETARDRPGGVVVRVETVGFLRVCDEFEVMRTPDPPDRTERGERRG